MEREFELKTVGELIDELQQFDRNDLVDFAPLEFQKFKHKSGKVNALFNQVFVLNAEGHREIHEM